MPSDKPIAPLPSAPPAPLWLEGGDRDFAPTEVARALALDEALLEEAHEGCWPAAVVFKITSRARD